MNDPTMEITTLGSVAGLIASTLQTRGCDPQPLLAAAGIEPQQVADPNARFPMVQMQKLWKLAVEASRDPCLGLAAARQFQPAMLHGLGLAWLVSDSVLDGLDRLVRYSRLVNSALRFQIKEDTDSIRVIVQPETLPPDFEFAALDLAMAAFLRMCQITSGCQLMPRFVTLRRPAPPPCPGQFKEIFGPSVEYGASLNQLCFDQKELTRQLTTANPELARINDQVVVDYLARFDRNSIAMQVRSRIIHQLPDGIPTQEAIANTLHVSLRSLQRRLKEEDTSFRNLLEEIRQQLARQYLRDGQRSIGEITYLLGFTEPSNFTRAFKRWTGQSPAQYRAAG